MLESMRHHLILLGYFFTGLILASCTKIKPQSVLDVTDALCTVEELAKIDPRATTICLAESEISKLLKLLAAAKEKKGAPDAADYAEALRVVLADRDKLPVGAAGVRVRTPEETPVGALRK
jgi:hypothetical protein